MADELYDGVAPGPYDGEADGPYDGEADGPYDGEAPGAEELYRITSSEPPDILGRSYAVLRVKTTESERTKAN
ncbi:hypothetical protein PV708_40085 [Streptomyces sp. ME02-6977A]|uniref:hypothetical protein n=1 Tax=Streptomyces sp. ME02-6977A TaxID=3028671 RepID=UPI0029BDFB94|nr:hypothetical protein [Streptomyces sp. ME02-6977A]MDX3412366.1 hypothetical protein [Streptomyces sp. ME02-6977A]